jgi:hypothetical protein
MVTKTRTDKLVRDELTWLLSGGHAHAGYDRAVADLPARMRGAKAPGVPWSSWMLVEHLRLVQFDIVDFCRNPKYKERKWPDEYWPSTAAPPSAAAWSASIAAFKRDLRTMIRLVNNPRTDLHARIPWWREPVSVLREALLVADHNAYHIGQLIGLRRALGAWKD